MRSLRRSLASTIGAAAFVAVVYTTVAIVCAARFGRRACEPAESTPPVTLLVPLHNAEPGLEENLRSFAEQDYPDHQLVLGVAEEDDAALPIARRVAAAFPHRRIDIAIGYAAGARNPKIANVLSMMRLARHDVIVLADSDTRVDPSYVRSVVAPLHSSEVGLVTCLFAGEPDGSLVSRLGAMWMNEQFIPSALVDRLFGPLRHGFGPTNAFRRAVLESIGGFEALAPHLADDFMLGHFVAQRGLRVVLPRYVVRTQVTEPSLRALWEKELRWNRTIRSLQPLGYAGLFLTYPVPLALLAWRLAPTRSRLVLVLAALIVRYTLQQVASRALGARPAKPWLVPLRDVLGLALWMRGLTGKSVRWRGATLRVAQGDVLEQRSAAPSSNGTLPTPTVRSLP